MHTYLYCFPLSLSLSRPVRVYLCIEEQESLDQQFFFLAASHNFHNYVQYAIFVISKCILLRQYHTDVCPAAA